jgi:DNA-binding NarL/FixJ family response regulator
MKEVLIVEDHPFVAEATKALIARIHPELSTRVCDAAAPALSLLRDPGRCWHRVLLDLDIPGAHGLSLALELHRWGLAPRTCVVTAMDRADFSAQLKDRGFLGYILKATPAPEFSAALAEVFEGRRIFLDTATTGSGRAMVRITRRQAEVLDLVRQGYSSKRIAAELSLTEGTVNNHMNALMGVLNASSRSHAVARAIELGLLRVTGSMPVEQARS